MRMLILLYFLLPGSSLLIKCTILTSLKKMRLYIFRFSSIFILSSKYTVNILVNMDKLLFQCQCFKLHGQISLGYLF